MWKTFVFFIKLNKIAHIAYTYAKEKKGQKSYQEGEIKQIIETIQIVICHPKKEHIKR